MIDIFHRAGVLKMLEGGHIAGRTGDWSSQFAPYVPRYENGKKKLVQYPMESEQAVNFYRQFIPSLAAHLKEAYPKVLYAQHIADEPTSDNIKSYVAIARFVKQQCPDIKIIEACHTHDLENILDIWVPQLNFYKEGYDFYRERQKTGRRNVVLHLPCSSRRLCQPFLGATAHQDPPHSLAQLQIWGNRVSALGIQPMVYRQ